MATRWACTVAALTLAADVAGQTAGKPPSITVVAYNQAAVAPDTLARAKSEVTRIYGEVGAGSESDFELSAFHVFLVGKPKMVVHDAIAGAVRRLAKPECQRLFDDFEDSNSQPLGEILRLLRTTPSQFLTGLYFVDGQGSSQCASSPSTAAFTEPGSRVIHVCGDRFAERFARKTSGGEILIIHELLHTLGLGENPPTSAQITDRVWARCR